MNSPDLPDSPRDPSAAQGRGVASSPAALVSGEVAASAAPHPLSVFDMFRIGIGPSSSHTVGPMRAGRAFAAEIRERGVTPARVTIDLFGSLGATGRGHNTDRAVLLGLAGHDPETVDIPTVESILPWIARTGRLPLADGDTDVAFDIDADVRFRPGVRLPYHVNALTITAFPAGEPPSSPTPIPTPSSSAPALTRTYYSVGGGFVMRQTDASPADPAGLPRVKPLDSPPGDRTVDTSVPYPFASGAELLDQCRTHGLGVAELVRANEEAMRPRAQVDAYLDRVAAAMLDCIDAGCAATGILPGGLDVPRRAHALFVRLRGGTGPGAVDPSDPLREMDWVNLFALAVNEENASGHRVVTAPTNGAAGVVPAVLAHLAGFRPGSRDEGDSPAVTSAPDVRAAVRDFLLTASAVGALIKTNASIAGAEVGCQGEVGSASSMAAAGLAQALGGTPLQVENAAEIAMEHSLGLTCDPVGGLVQIPCIERNAIAAVKAINAARMALWGDGRHVVSLDAAIETMRQTGNDMLSKYKETSAGGLAVNVVEC